MREEEDQTVQAIAAARQALGLQLAALRRAAGYTQKEFAPLTGYQRGTLANVETGRQNAPRVFWERCAQALGAEALLTGYDQIQAMATAHRQETTRRVQAASDAMIRAWQDSWHHAAASNAIQFVALPAPRQADEIHVWLSTPDGNIAHHMIVRRADVTVSQLAVVLGKLLRPDGGEVDDQEKRPG
ncbi:MAG: helix-turn-helix domain-containing protein [Streptosporangiaceae bacterium]|nr:helix-turn-helix domain-containing protein [Streptosporangiaceae bacterium]